MFDFLFQKKNKEMQSMAEVIALDLEKLNLSKLAIEKAVMMIARAIAKSDIIVQTDSTQKSSIEYRLNVMPNDHECGTYFWTRIIRELLWTQEALIIPMNGKYYKASAWQVSNSVLSERIYSNITIECAGEQYGLYKKFMSSEVIHLRYDNAKIRVYLESVVNQYNNTLNAINYMIRLSNQPKFKLKLGAAQSFREKQADGTDKIVTKDMYAEKIKRMLESEDLTVMTESEGVSLENIQINASAKAEELAKVALLNDAPAEKKAEAIMQSIEMIQEAAHICYKECPCDDTHDNVPSAFNCNAAIAAVGVLQSPATINIGDVKVGKSGFINGNGNPRLVTFSRKYSLFFTTPLIICL